MQTPTPQQLLPVLPGWQEVCGHLSQSLPLPGGGKSGITYEGVNGARRAGLLWRGVGGKTDLQARYCVWGMLHSERLNLCKSCGILSGFSL